MIPLNPVSIPLFSINRNIMECKDQKTKISDIGKLCINRNIMECKGLEIAGCINELLVLIETLWNVKSDTTLLTASLMAY